MARVLIVEDDHDAGRLMQRWLQHDDHEAELVATAEAGLERIEDERWDAILLDLVLPGISGHEFARSLQERGDPPPIIVVTITEQDEFPLDVPIAGWLTKPYTRAALREVVDCVVDGAHDG